MKRRKHILSLRPAGLAGACALLLLAACQRETVPAVFGGGEPVELGPQDGEPVYLSFETADLESADGTKSRFGETVCSGYLVNVYLDGVLISSLPCDGSASSAKVSLYPGFTYTFAVERNMWRVKKSDGTFEPFPVPAGQTALSSLVYRVDGADEQDGYRYPTFSETVSKGIPACGCGTISVVENPSKDPSLNCLTVSLKPLFAKITLTVDQSGLEGSTEHGVLTGGSVYIRNVNAAVAPFGSGSKGAAGGLLDESDYDNPLVESAGVYTFYAPENMAGTVAGITESDLKTPANAGAVGDIATYLEYRGTVDSGTGIAGDVCYRFCLGANATTDFNLERAKSYSVTLTFRSSSLLGDGPDWKIDASSVTDSRTFYLSKTADGEAADRFAQTTDESSMQRVVVRYSHDNVVYPRVELGGVSSMGTYAEAASATLSAHAVPAADLSVNRIVFVSEELSSLRDEYGIAASYDDASGCLTFSVEDDALYYTHLDEEVTVNAYLVPGYIRRAFRVRLMDDISCTVAHSLSLSSGFYIGMSRDVTVSGIYGSDRTGTLVTSDGTTSGLSLSPAATLRPADTTGQDQYAAITGTAESSSVADFSSAVRLYAMARNAKLSDKTTDLRLSFADPYNNPDILLTTTVLRPFLSAATYLLRTAGGTTCIEAHLPVDGSVQYLDHGWFNASYEELSTSSSDYAHRLDADLYTNIMEWFNGYRYFDTDLGKWLGTYPGDNDRTGLVAAGQFLYEAGCNPNAGYEDLRYLDNTASSVTCETPGNRLCAFIGSFKEDTRYSMWKANITSTFLGSLYVQPYWEALQGDGSRLAYSLWAKIPWYDSTESDFSDITDSEWYNSQQIFYDSSTGTVSCNLLTNTSRCFSPYGNVVTWIMSDGYGDSSGLESPLKYSYLTHGEHWVKWNFSPIKRDASTYEIPSTLQSSDICIDRSPVGEVSVECTLKNRNSGEWFGFEEDGGQLYCFRSIFKVSYVVRLRQCIFYPAARNRKEAPVAIGSGIALNFELLRNAYPTVFPDATGTSGSGSLDILENELRVFGNLAYAGTSFDITASHMFPSTPSGLIPTVNGQGGIYGEPQQMDTYDTNLWNQTNIDHAGVYSPRFPFVQNVEMAVPGMKISDKSNILDENTTGFTTYCSDVSTGYVKFYSGGSPEQLSGYGEY